MHYTRRRLLVTDGAQVIPRHSCWSITAFPACVILPQMNRQPMCIWMVKPPFTQYISRIHRRAVNQNSGLALTQNRFVITVAAIPDFGGTEFCFRHYQNQVFLIRRAKPHAVTDCHFPIPAFCTTDFYSLSTTIAAAHFLIFLAAGQH